MHKSNGPTIVIVGPTSIGKTDYAIELAEYLAEKNIESAIINADAFQLYKDMNIGTAKPTEQERKGIEHYQIDALEVDEVASVAVYQKKARAELESLLERNVIPIVVGGSGLYVRALIDKMSFAPTDEKVRQKLYDELDKVGVEKMYSKLEKLDPKAAENILPNNARRIVRALEVIEITNDSYSAFLPDNEYFYENVYQFGLAEDLEILDKIIEKRTENMFKKGLVNEVISLKDKLGVTSKKAIGYKEILDALSNAETPDELSDAEIENCKEQISLHTKQLVRKQISWFKRDTRIDWIQNAITKRPSPDYIYNKVFAK